MAVNVYGRLDHFLADIHLDIEQVTLADQERWLRRLEASSRWAEGRIHGRTFVASVDTRYFTGRGYRPLYLAGFDLLSVDSVAVDEAGDGTYGTTIVEGTDFELTPASRMPKREIDLLVNTSVSWPSYRRSVRITGTWGYCYTTESTGRILGTALNNSATSLTLDAESDIQMGEILVIDDEQLSVLSFTDNVTLVVERGANGTTAASHLDEAPIRRRTYPAEVVEAVFLETRRSYVDTMGGLIPGEYARALTRLEIYDNPWAP